mmetsp:Transcript_19084/g.39259  ORF Transcript_19084/g.39259 Transcript_19084/m.39259 type:complete len:257 (-) Transcript_19084:276-1046(-)
MKITSGLILVSVGGAAAWSQPTRGSLRSLGQKQVVTKGPSRVNGNTMKMEDFGFLKGTGIGFDDLWGGEEVISEAALERRLNKDGLRFRMNRTPAERAEVGRLGGLPGVTVNLPIIGETYLGPPEVGSIWEALGFTATSNNAARQAEKKAAVQKCMTSKSGVDENQTMFGPGGGGAEQRKKWLDKYGYPRLVGTGGIFYADQLSTDAEPSGGFNMGKSGSIWPVPDVVKEGQYGGSMGWGMKKKGPAIDGLAKEKI